MSAFIVWIDRENAKLFELSKEEMKRKILQLRHAEQLAIPQDEFDRERETNIFFHNLALELFNASSILILGPGLAKYHMQVFLSVHYPTLSKTIVGCEAVDRPTDTEIATYARKYFSRTFAN